MQRTIRFFVPCLVCLALLFVCGCGGGDNVGGKAGTEPITFTTAEQTIIDQYVAKNGSDVKAVKEGYGTLLERAIMTGVDFAIIKFLVSKGSDINRKDEYGITPLHSVARQDNFEVLKFLVSHGADVNAKDKQGYTPLDFALIEKDNFPANVEYLESVGAKSGK